MNIITKDITFNDKEDMKYGYTNCYNLQDRCLKKLQGIANTEFPLLTLNFHNSEVFIFCDIYQSPDGLYYSRKSPHFQKASSSYKQLKGKECTTNQTTTFVIIKIPSSISPKILQSALISNSWHLNKIMLKIMLQIGKCMKAYALCSIFNANSFSSNY